MNFADCDGVAANGCETDLRTDNSDCGACGNACSGAAGTCSAGVCLACNPRVLLLGDDHATEMGQISALLTAAGLVPTLVSRGVDGYTGSPAATGFGAIFATTGDRYDFDMPAAGQAAVDAAVRGGAGFVFTEWAAYHILNSRWSTLRPYQLFTRSSGNTGRLTFTREATHPIWAGLPASFTTVSSLGVNVGATLVNGGVRIAGCDLCTGVGVAVRDSSSASGRVVQIAHAANYTGSGIGTGSGVWTGDANTSTMLVNALLWAARCR